MILRPKCPEAEKSPIEWRPRFAIKGEGCRFVDLFFYSAIPLTCLGKLKVSGRGWGAVVVVWKVPSDAPKKVKKSPSLC